MPILYVQSVSSGLFAASTGSVTLSGVVTGDLVPLGLYSTGSGTTVSSVSDGVNTWTRRAGRQFQAGAGGSEIWVAEAVTGGNLTITVTLSASVNFVLAAAEYSSQLTPTSFDVSAAAGGSSTSISSGNVTTTQASELIIGVLSYAAAGGTFTAGSGFTQRQLSNGLVFEDQIVSSAGAYAATGSLSSSAAWTACIATFKAAPGFAPMAGMTPDMQSIGSVF